MIKIVTPSTIFYISFFMLSSSFYAGCSSWSSAESVVRTSTTLHLILLLILFHKRFTEQENQML